MIFANLVKCLILESAKATATYKNANSCVVRSDFVSIYDDLGRPIYTLRRVEAPDVTLKYMRKQVKN